MANLKPIDFKGNMPCHPGAIAISDIELAFPNLFDHSPVNFSGEAATRLIRYSQANNRWVGVYRKVFEDCIIEEHKISLADKINHQRIRQKYEDDFCKKIKKFNILNVGTLGIYSKFSPKPVYEEEPGYHYLASYYGAKALIEGLQDLICKGLVRVGKHGVSEGYIFPDPKLIFKILESQIKIS